MSVIIRRTGYSYTWTCKITLKALPGFKGTICNHTAAAATEAEAKAAYAAHKKTAKDH